MRAVVAIFVGLLIGGHEAAAQPFHDVSIDHLINLEKEVSDGQGRPIHCLLGYRSCLASLSLLDGKNIGGKKKPVALVAPYRKLAAAKDISVLATGDIYKLKNRSDRSAVVPYKTPDWALHNQVDEAFYTKIWEDGELNITLSLGYMDQGVGKNPNLFNYGVYATTLDRVHRFADEWNMTWTKIDDLESVAEVRIAADRIVRLRVIDPHVFCSDEQAAIDDIEHSIARDPAGRIVKFSGKGVLARKGGCALQEERSALAKHRFMAALSGSHSDDMVFYDGHSRHGRGPDFGPFSGKSGKVAPKDLTETTVESKNLAAVYFNGCSGGRNYANFVAEAKKSGKIVAWNTKAPSSVDADDDLLLFAQSVIENRGLSAIERFVNLTQVDGKWPSQVKIDR